MPSFADFFKSKVKIGHKDALAKIIKDDAKTSATGSMEKQAFVKKAMTSLDTADKKAGDATKKGDQPSLNAYQAALRTAVTDLNAMVRQTSPTHNKVLSTQGAALSASLGNLADSVRDLPAAVNQLSQGFVIDRKKMTDILLRQKKLSTMLDAHIQRKDAKEQELIALRGNPNANVDELKKVLGKYSKFDKEFTNIQEQYNDAISDLRDLY